MVMCYTKVDYDISLYHAHAYLFVTTEMVAYVKGILWITVSAVMGANPCYAVSRFAVNYVSASLTYATLIVNVTDSVMLLLPKRTNGRSWSGLAGILPDRRYRLIDWR